MNPNLRAPIRSSRPAEGARVHPDTPVPALPEQTVHATPGSPALPRMARVRRLLRRRRGARSPEVVLPRLPHVPEVAVQWPASPSGFASITAGVVMTDTITISLPHLGHKSGSTPNAEGETGYCTVRPGEAVGPSWPGRPRPAPDRPPEHRPPRPPSGRASAPGSHTRQPIRASPGRSSRGKAAEAGEGSTAPCAPSEPAPGW